jgi:hypothetical protein
MNPEANQPDLESPDPESTHLESLGLEPLDLEPRDREPTDPVPVDAAPLQARAATPGVAKAAKRRAGVPVWRTGKPDAFLAAAVDTARTAIEGITAASDIGRHLAAKSEGDRLVTHLFECRLPGYGGWQWFAVLTRNSRSKVVTVNELGLLPSEESILAPEWVPWAERVRPEDEQEQEPEAGEHQVRGRGTAATEPADADAGPVEAASQDDQAQVDEAAEAPEWPSNHDDGTASGA